MATNGPDNSFTRQEAHRPIRSKNASIFIFILLVSIIAMPTPATPTKATIAGKGALTISMETTSARAMGSLQRWFGNVNELLYLYSVNEKAALVELAFPGVLIVAPDKTRLVDLLVDAATDIRINVETAALDRLFDHEAPPAAKVLNKQKELVGIIATRNAMETFRTGAVVRSSEKSADPNGDRKTSRKVSQALKSPPENINNPQAVTAGHTGTTHQALDQSGDGNGHQSGEKSGDALPIAANQENHGPSPVTADNTSKEAADKAMPETTHANEQSQDDSKKQHAVNETARTADHSADQIKKEEHQNTDSHEDDAAVTHSVTSPKGSADDGHGNNAHGPTFDDSLPRGVALIEAIIQPMDYELNKRTWGWRVNDLIRIGDNVKNFQLGVLEISRRSAIILSERVSRTGESARFDPQLENAMNWFMIKPDRYWFPSAESKYQDALNALAEYKERLAKKRAKFFNRADNLIPLLMAYEDLLGSCEENLVKTKEEDGTPVSFFRADDYLYYTKGVTSALLTILQGIEHDFADVISSRQALGDIHHAIESCHHAVEIDPLLIMNSDSSSIFANHRANQAAPLSHARFYLSVLIKALST